MPAGPPDTEIVPVGEYINVAVFKQLDLMPPANGSEELLVFQDGYPQRSDGLGLTNVVIKQIIEKDLTVPNAQVNWSSTEW